jgi:hypothetical protein
MRFLGLLRRMLKWFLPAHNSLTTVDMLTTYHCNLMKGTKQAVEALTFFRQSAHRWRCGCQPCALSAQEDSWYIFLLEADSTPGP